MDKLVLLAPMISFALIAWRGLSWTFIYFYIPLLFVVPSYLTMDGPGIPPLAFYTAAILPFFMVPSFWKSAFRDFHWLDLCVYAYIILVALSELLNNSMNSSRQLVFLNALTIWAPYVAIRHVILTDKMEKEMGRMTAITLTIVAIYNLYTFRFGVNHFLIIRSMWPFHTPLPGLAVWPRWGFFRASGPFMHPIMTGIAFGFALPAAMWIWRSKAFKFRELDFVLFGALGVGLITTMSRGPYMGAFLAVVLYLMGESRHRVIFFSAAGLLVAFLSIPASFEIAEYFDATRATAASAEQETAMYRRDLILNYVDVIKEKPWLGYSFMMVPVIGDQSSIDNAYLLLALQWGVPTVIALLLMIFGSIIITMILGVKQGLDPVQRGQMWAICGAVAGCGFSATTVALLQPTPTILIVWVGWTSALALRWKRGFYDEQAEEQPAAAIRVEQPTQPKMKIL